MASFMKCKKCGSTRWMQKELRKTGLVICDGVAMFSSHCQAKPFVFLCCFDCGNPLTEEESRDIISDTTMPQPRAAEAN